jgi:hypothetical protein
MVCECCKKKMLEGYIPTTGMWWIPKSGEKRWLYGTEEKNSLLNDLKTSQVKQEPAYYCPNCDRIVIDCKEIVE